MKTTDYLDITGWDVELWDVVSRQEAKAFIGKPGHQANMSLIADTDGVNAFGVGSYVIKKSWIQETLKASTPDQTPAPPAPPVPPVTETQEEPQAPPPLPPKEASGDLFNEANDEANAIEVVEAEEVDPEEDEILSQELQDRIAEVMALSDKFVRKGDGIELVPGTTVLYESLESMPLDVYEKLLVKWTPKEEVEQLLPTGTKCSVCNADQFEATDGSGVTCINDHKGVPAAKETVEEKPPLKVVKDEAPVKEKPSEDKPDKKPSEDKPDENPLEVVSADKNTLKHIQLLKSVEEACKDFRTAFFIVDQVTNILELDTTPAKKIDQIKKVIRDFRTNE